MEQKYYGKIPWNTEDQDQNWSLLMSLIVQKGEWSWWTSDCKSIV